MKKNDNIRQPLAFPEKAARQMRRNGMGCFLEGRQKIGIALSGGADSMALLHLGLSFGWETVALHCNFGLRGEESERDERFVADHCKKLKVELHKVKFDVAGRMEATGESVEMACRELRYDWFSKMAQELRLTAIALGHHRDDNVETFLLNILRGSGLGGAKGIPPRRGIFIRPLLGVSRGEITGYLASLGVYHVTDSSNFSNDYHRNKLRNIVIPAIEECFPGGSARIETSISHLGADNRLLRALVSEKRRRYCGGSGDIAVARLFADEPEADTLLYHILDGDLDIDAIKKLGHHKDESGKLLTGRSGLTYLLDRGTLRPIDAAELKRDTTERSLIIDPKKITNGETLRFSLEGPGEEQFTVRLITRAGFIPRRDPAFAWFDASMLDSNPTFTLRRPKTGDRIIPFGMDGSRLLSDIFSDLKFSLVDKRRQWVVTCGEKIIWVPGVKNSNLHRVSPATENILELHVRNIGEKS